MTRVSAALFFGLLLLAAIWILRAQLLTTDLPTHSAITQSDFAGTDFETSKGLPYTYESLLGHVTVAHVFFTSCPETCPVLVQRVKSVVTAFEPDQLKTFSLSVDPKRDTREALETYAAKRGLESAHWEFVCGPKESVGKFVLKAFKLGLGETPDLHSTHLVLIDKQAQIRGYYRSSEAEELERLKADIAKLL